MSERTRGQEMINGANAYLDQFSDKFTEAPWGHPCERLEGGAYTNVKGEADTTCEVGIPAGILYIINRDYLVDEEKGVVNVFCRYGKFRYVHTLSVNLTDTPSPQADDTGTIIR